MVAWWIPLLMLLMASTSSPDLTTTPFEYGMLILRMQSESPSTGKLTWWCQLLPRLTSSALYLGLITTQPMYATDFNMAPPNPLLVSQHMQSFIHGLAWMVGSETQRVAYCTGFPKIVIQACIHLLAWQYLWHLTSDLFLLILTILPLEPFVPKFSKVQLPNLSFSQIYACSLACSCLFDYCSFWWSKTILWRTHVLPWCSQCTVLHQATCHTRQCAIGTCRYQEGISCT